MSEDSGQPDLRQGGRRCAVLGSPVAHSLSPALHRAAYRHLGLSWDYRAIEVTEPELAKFVAGLDATWRGLSLTMPLKRVAVDVATELVEPVPEIGVANTLILEGDRRTAHNTDVPGMQAALAEAGVSSVERATILGGGSTAVATVAALAPMIGRVTACVRSKQRARALSGVAGRLGVQLDLTAWDATPEHLEAPVVVSTTPSGVSDAWVSSVPTTPGLLFDVVYEPWPTPLAAAWLGAGGRLLSGLDLLVHQAIGQVRLMTGGSVPIGVLREAATVARRHRSVL